MAREVKEQYVPFLDFSKRNNGKAAVMALNLLLRDKIRVTDDILFVPDWIPLDDLVSAGMLTGNADINNPEAFLNLPDNLIPSPTKDP